MVNNMKYIVANWKIYLNRKSSLELLRNIQYPVSNIRTIVCPSFAALSDIIKNKPSGIEIGAQNCFWEARGAYTGEVSPVDLAELGVKYVIIGHSERRKYLKETDEMVNLKLKAAMAAGLIPILCVGETAEEREKGSAEAIVLNQLKKDLDGVNVKKGQKIIIAYEPVWAIGTGNSCEPAEAVRMHELIKKEIKAPVLYGGSVDDRNVLSYLKESAVDGVLVGGASTKLDVFGSLLKKVSSVK
jgi:triosephosphate isomerase